MRRSRLLRFAYNCVAAVADPFRAGRAVRSIGSFVRDYRTYRRTPGAETLPLLEMMPALHDRLSTHDMDPHYFYLGPWAARRIVRSTPRFHLDIGSQTSMPTILNATLPVVYVDYRPLVTGLPGFRSIAGDLVGLPFASDSVASLSCLHVAEHVGLGRYGDPIDPAGTRKAAKELARVLAPGGNLYFAVPVGRERVAFNAHRIHAPETIRDYFSGLRLLEFSGVDDRGRFHENIALDALRGEEYGCGYFWFTKA